MRPPRGAAGRGGREKLSCLRRATLAPVTPGPVGERSGRSLGSRGRLLLLLLLLLLLRGELRLVVVLALLDSLGHGRHLLPRASENRRPRAKEGELAWVSVLAVD